MAYKDVYNLAVNNEYKGRLAAALVAAAIEVYGEDAGTPNHDARKAFAKSVAANPTNYANRMVWAVASLAGNESDAELKSKSILLWNAFAPEIEPTP